MTKTRLVIPKEERLYCLKWNLYIQYDGNGPVPEAFDKYIEEHDGNLPPYIPLPRKPVEFCPIVGAGTASWPGHGPLPASVLQYVMDHGALPRNTSDYSMDPEDDREDGDYDDG